ncbi:hypothetical protein Tco_1341761, partial [Tanacetum coccineum]
MSSQTRSSVGVDEETKETLRDTIALLMREEMEQLRDEMRKCSRVTTNKDISNFEGDDVRGWLFKSEQYFKVKNILDESKVNLISTHLYGIALMWHEQLVKIMGKDLDQIIYKDAILQRFGNQTMK